MCQTRVKLQMLIIDWVIPLLGNWYTTTISGLIGACLEFASFKELKEKMPKSLILDISIYLYLSESKHLINSLPIKYLAE